MAAAASSKTQETTQNFSKFLVGNPQVDNWIKSVCKIDSLGRLIHYKTYSEGLSLSSMGSSWERDMSVSFPKSVDFKLTLRPFRNAATQQWVYEVSVTKKEKMNFLPSVYAPVDEWLATHCIKGNGEGDYIVKPNTSVDSIPLDDPYFRLEVSEINKEKHVKKCPKFTAEKWIELNSTLGSRSDVHIYNGTIPTGTPAEVETKIVEIASRELKPGHKVGCLRHYTSTHNSGMVYHLFIDNKDSH